MGTITYPKGAPSSVGEQKSKTFIDRSAKEGYSRHGSDTSYPGSMAMPSSRNEARTVSRAPFVSGGNGQFFSASPGNKNHAPFPSEKGAGSLPSFPGSKPKEA